MSPPAGDKHGIELNGQSGVRSKRTGPRRGWVVSLLESPSNMPPRGSNKRGPDPADDNVVKKPKFDLEAAAGNSGGDNGNDSIVTGDANGDTKKTKPAGDVDSAADEADAANDVKGVAKPASQGPDPDVSANTTKPAVNLDNGNKKTEPAIDVNDGNKKAKPAIVGNDGDKKAKPAADVNDGDKKANKQTVLNIVKTYSPALKRRLEALMSHADSNNLVYNIQHLPDGSRWYMMDDAPRKRGYFLVDVATRKPVTILLVGKVVYTFLGKAKSTPPNSVSITVEPLDPRDQTKSDNVLSFYSKRKKDDGDDDLTLHNGVRASAWMLYEDEGDDTATAKVFTDIYDARTKFIMPVSELPKLSRTDIELGDLVVIEARITRYSPKQTNASPESPSKDWKSWNAAFRMQSCSLLKKHDPIDVDDGNDKPTASSSSKTWEI